MLNPYQRKRRASPKRAGLSISQFAAEVDLTPSIVRAAVKNGHIEAIPWGGVLLIPRREKQRFLAMWGQDDLPTIIAPAKTEAVAAADNDAPFWEMFGL